jgi:inner membrane protein
MPGVLATIFHERVRHNAYAEYGGISTLDNLTHTLIGLAAGEAVAQCTGEDRHGLPVETRRSLIVVLAAVGGNLPDLDLFYSYVGPDGKLDYLLEHRGYTHSIVGCVLLAAILYGGAQAWIRSMGLTPSLRDSLELAAVCVFGTLLHIAMDSLNSYGVHPFWPLQNRWFYGDSVFIVEPLYWISIAPLCFVVRSSAARVLLALCLFAALVACIVWHAVAPAWSIAIALATAALLIVGRQTSRRTASLASVTAMICVTAAFVLSGSAAAHAADSIARANFSYERLLDHVLTPAPTNPLCWDVLMLGTDGDRYTIRHAMLSVAPGLMPARQCTNVLGGHGTTAPLLKVPLPDSAEIHWLGQVTMSRARLADLVREHCEAAELMQFARAPFIALFRHNWVIGDFRFDREPQLGMAEIELADGSRARCSHNLPWIPPRADLLR